MTDAGGTQGAGEEITQHFAYKLPRRGRCVRKLKIKDANVDIRGKGGET